MSTHSPRRAKAAASVPAGPRIGLALAGGGPLGAIYEIGALCALQDALDGLDLTRLHHYVGVSAGGFIAAGLANGLSPRALCASFIENDAKAGPVFDPAALMIPAWGEFARRWSRLPWLASRTAFDIARGQPVMQALEQLGPLLPTGLLSNVGIDRLVADLLSGPGRSNDFRQLRTRLTLVATDLDTGESIPFGAPGWDHVPISRAVQATAALPGLFPPVEIEGRSFVDGALQKTMHASVALDDGVTLMLCLNPLVPFNARGHAAMPRIADGGLPAVMSQTFRTLIHSRLELGMKQYRHTHPNADIVLLEPDAHDPELYGANTFGYARRRELAEHAYQQTRAQLRARRVHLQRVLARHGLGLRDHALDDPDRRLLPNVQVPPATLGDAAARLDDALDRLAAALPAPAA